MCGIWGMMGDIPSKEICERARDTMYHRGPDASGIYHAPEHGIVLAQRRLAIIDLSPAGNQPFMSHDGRYAMIFNGEIYNYQEIKRELKGLYKFKTQSDTEVLLAAFITWGRASLQKFNGMFAFAVWDNQDRTLFIARDRLGIKPLYYYLAPNKYLVFSSEIKGILDLKDVPRRLNPQGFLDYLSYRYPLGDQTMFQGIFSLPPGYTLEYDLTGSLKRTPYWELPIVDKSDPGESPALEQTEWLLERAVKYRMISDVPVGAFLSGGLDSSLLVALMAKQTSEPIRTFSLGFDESGFSELEHARAVATLFKTDHHEHVMTGKEYFDLAPKVIRHKDAPLATQNEIALYALSKQVKAHATVLLGGDGADELFAGYGRIFRGAEDWLKMKNNPNDELKENLILKYGSPFPPTVTDHFLQQYSYIDPQKKQQLVHPMIDTDLLHRTYFENEFNRLKHFHPIDQYLHIFQRIHLLGPLQRLDVPTMAGSLEARVPFVDHTLVEYVSSLPYHYKLAWRSQQNEHHAQSLNADQISEIHDIPKYLLKKIASKYLPDTIVHRKKMGFPAPLDHWLSGEFNEMARGMLLSPQARSYGLYDRTILERSLSPSSIPFLTGMTIWMLVNLELWMQEYNVTV